MTKHLIFRLFVRLCFAFCLIHAAGLFAQAQRGMKVVVRTQAGQNISLYNKSYALVVGNGNYTDGWDPLKGVFKDVREVATVLEKHGFNVTLKTDLKKADFETAFEAFIRNGRDESSRLLFYYAGHGHTETLRTGEKLGYLVMVDSPMPTPNGKIDGSKNVDMESLVTQAKRIDALHVLYVFDSCFSGSILNARSIPQPPAIQNSVKYPVRQFITAGGADQPVPDYSVFKRAFLDLLEGKVDEPIPDGYITGEELGLYLKNEVPKYNPAQNPQYGKINDPNLDKGDFVFVLPRGSIFVNSQPAGAKVTLDGVLQSRRTPIRIQNVMAGTHMLKLTLQDYEDHMQQIRVEAGRDVQINPTLRWLPPRLPLPRSGRSKWPLIIGGGLAAVGAGVAVFVLSETNDNASGNGQINQPQTGTLTISISVP